MNAIAETHDSPARGPHAAPHPTHKFKLLLKREFWEHRGGFFWAPVIAGGISLLLTLMGIIVGLVAGYRAAAAGEIEIDGVQINGFDLAMLTSKLSAEDIAKLSQGIDLSLFFSGMWPYIVLAFVVFFYCIGALYDERKDRSVLFWKSLPLSDTETVLSKVASATLVAPVIAGLVGVATMFGFLAMISIVVLVHGGNPITLLWGPAHLFNLTLGHLTWIPVYALWALPTVGWLMLCSVWARSKPFLWAIMIPVFAGIFVSWFDVMELFNMQSGWFWSNVVGRALLGTVPGIHLPYREGSDSLINDQDGIEPLLHEASPMGMLENLSMPELWIGAVVGATLIFAAIRLRRWRDDN
ncbi:hypothetical protein [Marilutibacter chinensis]|uniref:ABC-2 type transport system permease protein n=1 Tax=Marilutibacter chinensis TaxID=2912247 RepID=A0ABS9HMI9_9GAMM|nr:hypothetical protein [Lysobacter chinensis]MCF7220246.1 hypothetical protein [Lysobacter chinensis]